MGQPTPPADPKPADPTPTEPTTEPATGDGLGEAGRKALAEERAARKELEKQLKALQERDPVKAIAEALGVKPATNGADALTTLTEQVKALQREQAEATLKAARLEIAAEKGLTPLQAARLQGTTREELAADADALKALFPTSLTPGTPAPDPSQGARGGANQLEASLKAAQEKGDTKEVIRIKNMLAAARRST